MSKHQNEEASRKTLELNFEINLFNDRLKTHMNYRTVDLELLEKLQETTSLISKLLSGCILIDTDKNEAFINSEVLQMHRQVYCRICNLAIKTDVLRVQEHLSSEQHQRIVLKKDQKKKKIFGNTNSITSNKNEELNMTFVQQPAEHKTHEPQIKLSKKVQVFLRDHHLEKLATKLTEEAEKIKMGTKHFIILESIEKALVSKYPNIKVYPFGSRISGLGSETSDLDLFIDLDNHYFKTGKNISMVEFKYIETELRKTEQWCDFFPITAARTPILQAVFKPENLPCDLSFTNGLSHCNTKLISFFIDIQPLFAKIAIIVKKWAQIADMKMNSYALTLLVVFYFQQVKLLPAVCEMQKEEFGKSISVGHWKGHIGINAWKETSQQNDFRYHLIDFFYYYGNNFDFQSSIVCPYLGESIKKKAFQYGKETLPGEFHTYQSYMKNINLLKAENLTDLFAFDKAMVIQDPFELIHNVAKGVKSTSCDRFISYCRLTSEFLKSKRVL
ncbi:terminal uridylyltransferase Tailor-like [Culicoides brevitarsis]|uniref:terminal uridylyltransferase Tailor-like n=1 Tax=Culicoides brevitarsis TaxID=469753 RepID=UPI00307B1F3F